MRSRDLLKKSNALFPCIEGNALDTGLVRNVLESTEYDVVINCIGILNKVS